MVPESFEISIVNVLVNWSSVKYSESLRLVIFTGGVQLHAGRVCGRWLRLWKGLHWDTVIGGAFISGNGASGATTANDTCKHPLFFVVCDVMS